MTDLAIETSALRKVYGVRHRVVGVDDLDLRVERGGVHALLGPEGSGKSAVLRMLLGLVQPTSGRVEVLGEPLGAEVLDRVGAVVDEQGFTPTMTVRRSLDLLAGLAGADSGRVTEVLEQADLAHQAKVRIGFLTDGEEQRLGIAAALLKEPELLVLDEPTTGLDEPEAEAVTTLVRTIAANGVTVLMSTPDLAEVQDLCRSVAILLDGRLLASGLVQDLLGDNIARTRVHVRNPSGALRRLREAGYTAQQEGEELIVDGHEHPEEITRVLAEESLYVDELSVIRPDLQSFFRRLQRDGALPPPKGGKRKRTRRDRADGRDEVAT